MSYQIVLFGITGDLAGKKTLPAIYRLYKQDKFPKKFELIGVGRSILNKKEFERKITDALSKTGATKSEVNEFITHTNYIAGKYDDPELYAHLKQQVIGKVLLYISLPPFVYEDVIRGLGESTLLSKKNINSTLMVEKPFGNDVASAKKLNSLIRTYASEKQILRIDHYLGKKALLGLGALSQNDLLKMLSSYTPYKVECTIFETAEVADRGSFYDASGALKDVGQNHLIQMLIVSLPFFLKNIKGTSKELEEIINTSSIKHAFRAQYEGYKKIEGVAPTSETETFFRFTIRKKEKRNIEIVLQAGKALRENRSDVRIYFLNSKKQGTELRANFNSGNIIISMPDYKIEFSLQGDEYPVEAYEKVIFDAYKGNQKSFADFETILASWRVTELLFEKLKKVSLKTYPIGIDAHFLV